MIGRDGVGVNRAFSAGTFRVSRDLGRTPQVRPSESVLWRTGNEFCAFGAKRRPKIPSVFLRTDLINRKRVRCWRFGAAARREEGEYPLWICDRRATLLQRQRSATLPGYALVGAWRRCSSVTERFGYAPSSRLASRPPERSALIPYL